MERIAHAYPLRALSLLLVICLAFCWPAPALADSASASDATASSIPQAETPTYKVAFYLHAVRGSAAQPALSRWQGPGPTPCMCWFPPSPLARTARTRAAGTRGSCRCPCRRTWCGRSSAAISRAWTRWEGAAFSISITNNKAGGCHFLRLVTPALSPYHLLICPQAQKRRTLKGSV